MPNHIHIVPFPSMDKQLSKFMHWLTMTFTQRYHKHHQTVGTGHLFQGRFKSFLVQNDRYLLTLLLYVERNALKAGLVNKAEEWRWSSLWIREKGSDREKEILSAWPIEVPENYLSLVNNMANAESENEKIEEAISKSSPLGDEVWVKSQLEKLNLPSVKKRGRPKKR